MKNHNKKTILRKAIRFAWAFITVAFGFVYKVFIGSTKPNRSYGYDNPEFDFSHASLKAESSSKNYELGKIYNYYTGQFDNGYEHDGWYDT